MQIFFTRLQGFHYGVQRQDKDFVRHFDRHAVEDRQRQRQQDADSGARSLLRFDLNVAAHLLDVTFHHVHAHAAPGHVGHLFGG